MLLLRQCTQILLLNLLNLLQGFGNYLLCYCRERMSAKTEGSSVKGFPSILFEAYELFFFEFFLSLFFVICGNSIVLREKRFSSIMDIFFRISFVRVTLIIKSNPLLLMINILHHNRVKNFTVLHYFFTIFH